MALEQDQRISEVVKRERSRLRNFIRRRVPDPRDAEDILQDVFYELMEVNRSLIHPRSESKWKFRLEPNYEEDNVKSLKKGIKGKHFRPMFVPQALHAPLFGRFKSLQYLRPPFVYRNGWMSRRASPR